MVFRDIDNDPVSVGAKGQCGAAAQHYPDSQKRKQTTGGY